MTPTGNAEPLPRHRLTASAASSSALPHSAAAGSAQRWSCPTRRFTAWGQMMPTKPIMPKNDTHTAVMRDASSSDTHRSSGTFTPMLPAASPPLSSAL